MILHGKSYLEYGNYLLSCPRIEDVRLLQDEVLKSQTLLLLGQLLSPEHVFDIPEHFKTISPSLRALFLSTVRLKILQN